MEHESSIVTTIAPGPRQQDGSTGSGLGEQGEKPRSAAQGQAAAAKLRLFVVHAPADFEFVEGFLLGAVGLPHGEVLCSSNLELGAVIVEEIARGAVSPVTVVVASPAFLASPWARFAEQLALHHSVEATDPRSATLVPALLADCDLPLLSRFRVALDFRNQDREHWEAEVAKLREKLAAPAPSKVQMQCPYPGIRPFTTEDAARFHGRDHEVRDLLGQLRDGQSEIYVIGPSGSGKSSLVSAGLVPSLRHSPELAGGSFLVRQMRPGADPTAALAAALEATAAEQGEAAMQWLGDAVGSLLATHAAHGRVLIFVDQLEELFTTAEPTARVAFVAALRRLRADPRVALVLTLRADFFAALMESALWPDLDGRLSRLEVSPLRGNKLRIAIEAPARALGVYFEPVLVERLLHDVADAPGALPLLQDVLLDLWHQRTRALLRLAEYEAMSDGGQTGLAVMMARRANGALNDLSSGRREIARRVLLRLVQFGDGTATTRRQQARAALATACDAPEDIDAVVRHLTDRRLLTTSGGDDGAPSSSVDLAHEVLLSAWPVLGEWIRSRREDERRRRVLEAKAAEWVNSGRGQSRLLDADELREIRSWLSDDRARDLGMSAEIQGLLAASEASLMAQIAEAEGRRRRVLRWTRVAISALVGLVVAIIGGTIVLRSETRLKSRGGYLQKEDRRLAGYSERVGRDMTAMLQLLVSDQRLQEAMAQVAVERPAAAAVAGEVATMHARQMYDALSSKGSLNPDAFALFTTTNRLKFVAPPRVLDEPVLATLAVVDRARGGTVVAHRIQMLDGVPYQMSAMPIRSDNDQVVGGILVGVKLQRLFDEFAEQSDEVPEMQLRPTLINGATILASAWPVDRRAELARAMQPEKYVRATVGEDTRDVIRLRDGDFDFWSDDSFEGYNAGDAGVVGRLVITRSRGNVVDPASKLPLLEILVMIGASIVVTMLMVFLITRRSSSSSSSRAIST